jgi:hypothetical protein
VLLLLHVTGCTGNALPDSIWPPVDFELAFEEVKIENGTANVVRRFRARADGVVAYATSSRAIVDATTGTALPVFDRLSVYELVPTSIRALARRIDRCGILEFDRVQGERGVVEGSSLVLSWQAFYQRRVITARGRVHGAMAQVLAIVAEHLPDGEAFGLPELGERPVVPVLRGVPDPLGDAAGALHAHRQLLARRPADRTLLLDAFALACDLGRRSAAEELLAQWLTLTATERHQQEMFPEQEPRLTAALLERLLPPAR